MIKPITPNDLPIVEIPDEVISAFNTMIIKEWNGFEARVKQKDVVIEILANFEKSSKKVIAVENVFKNRYLDVEEIYRKQGWNVEYDKPAYNETYDAWYHFKPAF